MNRRATILAARRGFTLLEMMLVVVIMGLLMSVAVFSLVGQSDSARVKTTKASLHTIDMAIQAYYAEKGVYPPSLTALQGQYLQKAFKDAWKHEFVYQLGSSGGHPYSLISMGKDGESGTADDIDVWRLDEEDPATPGS